MTAPFRPTAKETRAQTSSPLCLHQWRAIGDFANGLLSVRTPLGKNLLGCVEEDEIELEVSGNKRRVLIVRTERSATTMH
jgi:Transcription elongation factor, GreA/GreB, C-term